MSPYTIDILIQAWREEQNSPAIQALPLNFTSQMKEVVSTLQQIMGKVDAGGLQAAITRKEVDMIKYLWRDLLKLRKDKIDRAITSSIPVNEQYLLEFELDYYRGAGGLVYKYGEGKAIFPETRSIRELSSNYVVVKLVENSDPFAAIDLRTYGPFKKEDIAYIPKEHAEILIAEGKAKRVMIPAD